jgi:S-DNA-T family DNA segregation ATPase FtsK/SpoIIIE
MAVRQTNRLRIEPLEEEPIIAAEEKKAEKPEKKAEKKEKKEKAPKPPRESIFTKMNTRLEEWKVIPLTGLFFILASVCMFIAFVSYLFTWQVDYDKVSGPVSYIFSPAIKTENWLGNFGAKISSLFIGEWFGIASFGFVLLFFIWGVWMLFRLTLLPLKRHCVFPFSSYCGPASH